MRELRMTDGELQRLIAPAIRKKLKAAGFVSGTPSDEHAGYFFPINIEMNGLEVTRHEDGTWTFVQEDLAIAGRLNDTLDIHGAAIENAAASFFNKET